MGDEEKVEPWKTAAKERDDQQGRALCTLGLLEHNSLLSVHSQCAPYRLTGIICTLGPASTDPDVLDDLLEAGLGIARLNFSHGTHEYHEGSVLAIREAAARRGLLLGLGVAWPVAIALDTRGPEIRTGLLEGGPMAELYLVEGDDLRITTDEDYAEASNTDNLYVDYENITGVVKEGNIIYFDDGLISAVAKQITKNAIMCEVQNGGCLGSRKGVNLPGIAVDLPGVSEKDREDLRFVVEQQVDMVFASFIRNAQTVRDVRAVLGEDGKDIFVISKIENQQGIDNIDEIIEESDGIMVARGDMGIEIAPEKVFLAQKAIIAKCQLVGKPVVCATQMLESMTDKPRATRAECTDVANAVLDGADCVMLSGETAMGKYPVECVKAMSSLCMEAESAVWSRRLVPELLLSLPTPADPLAAASAAAIVATMLTNGSIIVVLTVTGASAIALSRLRPRCPIVAVTRSPEVARKMLVMRGVVPLQYTGNQLDDWPRDQDLRIQFAITFARTFGIVKAGDGIVLVSGWRPGPGHTNKVRVMYAAV